MMNPWRLRLLSQLDTLGTVRAVTQAANLSPSSVSQQLGVLEAETRTQLLERTGRRVRLTQAGLILARRARAILDHMDTVEAELRGFGFGNYMMAPQHVEAGLSIALLPGLAVDRRYRVATRELATPVTRTITAAIRRSSPPRAAVHVVLDALRHTPDLPQLGRERQIPSGT